MSSTVISYEIPIPIAPLPSRFFMPLCPLYGKAMFSLRWVRAMSWKEERLDRFLEHMRLLRVITPELLTEVIAEACVRFAAHGSTAKTRIHQLAEQGAWIDAVLGLLELELPHWRLRRLLYEDGEWHCFLTKRLEIPLELDDGVEASGGYSRRLAISSRGAGVPPPRWRESAPSLQSAGAERR
jgi:hypothetical protein